MQYKRFRGSITPFLCLILGLMLSLVMQCLKSVRMASARTQILCAADIGLYSVFGQYDRILFRKYAVLAVDGSDGNGNLALSGVYDEYMSYMLPVLSQNSQNLVVKSGGFSGVRLITDVNGEAFYNQVNAYMDKRKDGGKTEWFKAAAVIKAAEERGENLRRQDILEGYHRELSRALDLSREKEAEPALLSDGSQITATAQMPLVVPVTIAEMILQRQNLLEIIPEGQAIAPNVHTPHGLLEREWNTGMPVLDSLETDDSQAGKRKFIEYLSAKLGCFTHPSEEGLVCQREYLLFRNKGDEENLRQMIRRLFAVRLWLNYEAMQSDPQAAAVINEMTQDICRRFLIPPDSGIVSSALLYGWCCAESLADVRLLLSGEKTELKKTGGYVTDLYSADQAVLGQPIVFAAAESAAGVLAYEDYLGAFLWQMDKPALIYGAMDMIEDTVRCLGYPSFCIDCCLTAAEISQDIRANRRKTFTVNRMYSYR